jgi:hypothetical protein
MNDYDDNCCHSKYTLKKLIIDTRRPTWPDWNYYPKWNE